jgi:integrase
MPKYLTDRSIKAEMNKPAPKGKRRFVMDGKVRAFGIAVNERGEASYFLNARFPGTEKDGKHNPSRRSLGRVGEISLTAARAKAEKWKADIDDGLDPAAEAERERRENARKRANTVAAIAEDFIASLPSTERKREEVARDIRREIVGPLGSRSFAEVQAADIRELVRAIKDRPAPHQARNVLGYCRRMFGWAVAEGAYGREASPCDPIRPKTLLGPKKPRKRVLADDELRAVWQAAEDTPYPYGPLFRLLLLTGARKSDIAKARWSEIRGHMGDSGGTVGGQAGDAGVTLDIPAARYKSDDDHVIPLPPAALDIIRGLDRWVDGEGKPKRNAFLFSTTNGDKPVNGFSKAKLALDKGAAKRLGRKIEPFTIHDLRRTMRTHLSALPIPQHIAERIIGHAQPGLLKVYDRYSFAAEKRHGLELWAERLAAIVADRPNEPEGGNVIRLLWKSSGAEAV